MARGVSTLAIRLLFLCKMRLRCRLCEREIYSLMYTNKNLEVIMSKKFVKLSIAFVLSIGLLFGSMGVVQGASCEYESFVPLNYGKDDCD